MATNEFEPDTKTVTQYPSLLCDAGSGAVLLVNSDPNNLIYIGGDRGVSPQMRVTATISPLGSLALDSTDGPIYGVCSVGQSAICQIIPKGTSYAPSPVLIAQQVLNSGVIIVDNPKILINGNQTVNSGGVVKTYGPFLVNTYNSWYINFQPFGATPGIPYLQVNIYWTSDAAGQNTVANEVFVFPDSPSVASLVGHGPMRGAYMWMTFSNYDNATNSTFGLQLVASTRLVTETLIKGQNLGVPPGIGLDNVVVSIANDALAANSSDTKYLCNYYQGPAFLRFNASATNIVVNSASVTLNYEPVSDFQGKEGMYIQGPPVANGGNSPEVYQNIILPRRPVTVQVSNHNAFAIKYRLQITGA